MKPSILAPPVRNRPMRLYISASESTIGSMLVQENENGVERPVYYLSRMLNGLETRYSDIEKLCLCLYLSCIKLKQYIKPVDVYVSSHFDITKHMLSKPILHSRIGKWALALTEYSLTYLPLKAIKGQVVADFLVNHSTVEMAQNYVDTVPWKLYFDCSSHKNRSGIGRVIISPAGIPAEFKLLKRFEQVNIRHIPRKENQEANDLAQEASGYKALKDQNEEEIQVREKVRATLLSPSDLSIIKLGVVDNENFEIMTIDDMGGNDWRKPIVDYLRNPTGLTDRKIKYRALSYVLMGNELFKKTIEGVLLKCLGENEAFVSVSNVHSGTCDAHQAGQKMRWLLMRSGVYWPSMLKDCIEFSRGCQECQLHGGIQHMPVSELHMIIKPWPFRRWALDVIGEIRPSSSKKQKYILVGIDYFTKWVEAVALTNVDQETVIDFIQNHIMCRFGVPETITTDQGTIFTGRKVQDFTKEVRIKLLTSTPYYAQANAQVEAANKVIISLIKKHVGKKPKKLA
ncbi:uncharacterized protein LOC131620203 [Vicia villosa]|uniref:uncharacterized protein LOC131620203 n=1 Tax=Vicia villosa TaxID=3911 RepID=UPI00273B56EB|nr:uncharacterized protein LOC131620203 [Vicia villosa]